jgi:hypothetical protein
MICLRDHQALEDTVSEAKRKRGRPAKYPKGERRPTLQFRVRGGLHEKLKAAATRSEMSISEEIEKRVTHSFDPVDALARLVGVLVRAGEVLTGKSWGEDRRTRELVFGLILQRFDAMMDDPTSALLAEEAWRTRQYFVSHAWRAPVDDPFVGMDATHLRAKPDEAEQAPEQAPEPLPVRSRKPSARKTPGKNEPATA